MAVTVWKDARVILGTTTLAEIKAVNFSYEAESLDDTVMGDDTRSNAGGLKVWSFNIEFLTTFSDAQDKFLFNKVGTATTVKVKPLATTDASATNPEWTGVGLLQNYPAVGNSVGELAGGTISILSAGTLTRVTAT